MVGMISAFAAVRMPLQICSKVGGGGSGGSISRIRLSISSLETGDAGARLSATILSGLNRTIIYSTWKARGRKPSTGVIQA
jgi:hypothetical protein